jgi:ribose transport system ATP-binding protein
MNAAVLSVRGLAKRYGAVQALGGVDLDVFAGEVHALLGENGAGKSTLLKVLAGVVAPDEGGIELDGAPYAPHGPRAAGDAGVAMIHQELALAPDLTVAANVMLGREVRRGGVLGAVGVVDAQRRDDVARSALARLGRSDIDPRARVAALGPGERQMVEIARALASNARVLILDEPTSSLAADDVVHLFDVLRGLARSGVAVVYVSHFLEEVRAVATRYTVLRDGHSVGTGQIAEIRDDALVTLMAGRAVTELFPGRDARAAQLVDGPRAGTEPPLLVVDGLTTARLPRGVSLTLQRGEVLGLAGLVGAGRTELLRGIFGLDKLTGGSVAVRGAVDHGKSPRERIAQGFGLLSEDRKAEGLALTQSLVRNATLARLDTVARHGWIDTRRQCDAARRWFERLGVRYTRLAQPASSLSGGNQQKVAFARLLFQDAMIALLDEPTRGVDVGARAELYRLIRALAADGRGVLMVSSYLPELMGTSDRIAVMHRGTLSPARPVEEWSEHALLMAATGAQSGAPFAGSSGP